MHFFLLCLFFFVAKRDKKIVSQVYSQNVDFGANRNRESRGKRRNFVINNSVKERKKGHAERHTTTLLYSDFALKIT